MYLLLPAEVIRILTKLLDHLPINIIAEHGAMIKEKGIWKNQINNNCFMERNNHSCIKSDYS